MIATKAWQVDSLGYDTLESEGLSSAAVNGSSAPLAVVNQSAKLMRMIAGYSPHDGYFHVWVICLGGDTAIIARGLFSALRELDQKNVDTILVEGIRDDEGGAAAAVMNRLRKAAQIQINT